MTDLQTVREALTYTLQHTDRLSVKEKVYVALDALDRLEAAAVPELSREALPHWEPCNPGCDPEFNGERTAYCAHLCSGAREAMQAASLVRSVPVGGDKS